MNTNERIRLSKEVEMQLTALKKITTWKTISLAVSALGVAVIYASMAGTNHNIFLSILGVIIILASLGSAIILNLGLKNGRRNVEKMLNVLDKEKVSNTN